MTDIHPFPVGSVVRRRAAPEQVGAVRNVVIHEQLGERLYRVRFGTQTKTVPERDLELLPEDADPWRDLREGAFGGAEAFQRLLTFERLRRPPSRVATTFGTARAKLFPYQFKPLLKFLDNPSQRILIADDVGLGKTVEAGYILKELRARHELERVLVVVPARLRVKWKTELERRFDEYFEIVSAKEFKNRFIEPLHRGREMPTFAWIASYESLRRQEITKPLSDLQPPIDLVIMDEAHKVRNSETNQHALATALAQADAMVFLTATPIQTRTENLFQLLRLLDPETFARSDVFEHQLQANRPVVQALAAIRQNPPEVGRARSLLSSLSDHRLTADLTKTDFFASLLERLDSRTLMDRRALVDLQRDMSELSVTSHVLSRTRKVEVMPDRPLRQATAYKVDLTPDERRVYGTVATIALLVNASLGAGAVLAAMMPVRYAASCLPAALSHFRGKYGASLDALCAGAEESLDQGDGPAPTTQLGHLWSQLRDDLATELAIDTKFARLREALGGVWQEDTRAGRDRRKVIVYSYFRGTLEYLSRRLLGAGVKALMIHGLVELSEREQLIDEFLTKPEVAVLLSSEVGSEGLDLQQASVVVNYDLPWNPMVVEQRIGRIDRLGQESRALTILSLVLRDTIEEQILYRLYERIGLFEETIGEIEPILGEQISKLAVAALRGELSPQEQEKQADLAADAFLNAQRAGETLQQEADQLIAGDQAFLDEVESLVGERKVPTASELYSFLDGFLTPRYPGYPLPRAAVETVAEVTLDERVAVHLVQELGGTAEVKRLASRVQGGGFPMTFDADAHLRRPRSELISIHHPLVRLALAMLERDAEGVHRTFHLRLAAGSDEARGDYLLTVLEFGISGNRARTELVPVLWDIRRKRPVAAEVSRRALVRLLDEAEEGGTSGVSFRSLEEAIGGTREYLGRVRAEVQAREKALQRARAERRRATRQATLDAKVDAARRRLETLAGRRAPDFPVRMARAKLQREENRLAAFLRESREAVGIIVEDREIAVALVSVRGSSEAET